MNKPLFRYITVIAILAVMALQGCGFPTPTICWRMNYTTK